MEHYNNKKYLRRIRNSIEGKGENHESIRDQMKDKHCALLCQGGRG